MRATQEVLKVMKDQLALKETKAIKDRQVRRVLRVHQEPLEQLTLDQLTLKQLLLEKGPRDLRHYKATR